MSQKTLVEQFRFCEYVMKKVLGGISHEESLLSPEPDVNCINWVIGHVVYTRNRVIGLVGKESLYPDNKFERYKQSSKPISPEEKIIQLDESIYAFEKIHTEFMDDLMGLSDDALDKMAPSSAGGNDEDTVGSRLAIIACHEAYHIGQIGLLRRLAGKAGAVD